MSAMPTLSRAHLFGIALAIAGLFFSACAEDQHMKHSGAPSGASMTMTHADLTSYDQAYGHAGDALQATREKDLSKTLKHAEVALKAAQAAKQEFFKMNIEQDAQRDFSDGMKSLEEAIAVAGKGDEQTTEELLFQTIFHWRPQPLLSLTILDSKKCHGETCIPSACGCANAGATKCNRFYPLRKCTPVGCNCYCQ